MRVDRAANQRGLFVLTDGIRSYRSGLKPQIMFESPASRGTSHLIFFINAVQRASRG